jgi:tRNA (pseudouridine54-N1)-methyltransferase
MFPPKRRFVIVGQKASASGEFLASDVQGTSGRLDVLLRCVRAALLWSHGIRNDVVVYLVLGGGPRAPRVVRIDGGAARFVRPDERSLATLAMKILASRVDDTAPGGTFAEVRAGIAVAHGGLDAVFADLGDASICVLDEHGADIRGSRDRGDEAGDANGTKDANDTSDANDASGVDLDDVAFFLGDHLGFEDADRAWLASRGARAIRVGPRSLHAEDAIAVVLNEIDRHDARRGLLSPLS